jgi:hypothetical protein
MISAGTRYACRSSSIVTSAADRARASRSRSCCSSSARDAVRRPRERGGRREQARDELFRPRQREHPVEELRQKAVALQRTLDLVERPQRHRAEQLAVALVEAAKQRHPETFARRRQRRAAAQRLVEQRLHLPLLHRHEDAVGKEDELLRRRLHGQLDRALHDLAQPRVRLEPRHVRGLLTRHLDAVQQLRDGALLDRFLAERRQHVRDVVHERRVRPDDEHPAQPLPMHVEKPRRTVKPDGGLPRAGPALHDERSLRLGRDQPVLVRLDGRDDVAHSALAPPLELLEQEVRDARAFERGAVERLVGDVEDATALRPVAAPLRHPLRVGWRRRVERPRRRRLPVGDEHLVVVVVDPATADIECAQRAVERQAAEAEPTFCVLERPQPPARPRLERERGDLVVGRVRGAGDGLAHPVETLVRVIDVRLLRCQLGMSHGRATVPT